MQLKVVSDLKETEALIRAFQAKGMNRLGRTYAQLLEQSSLQSFERQAEPETGKAWPPRKYVRKHSRGTSRGRPIKRKVLSRKTLIKTGALRRGVNAKHVVRDGKLYVIGQVSGTASVYSAVHQFGHGNVPRRAYVGYTPEHRQRAYRIATEHYKP